MVDLQGALDAAKAAGDRNAETWLLDLLTRYLLEDLANRSASALTSYVSSRQRWRNDNGLDVVKTPDQPAVAYTLLSRGSDVVLLALGFVYRYPLSEEAWWTDTIRPRLRHYA